MSSQTHDLHRALLRPFVIHTLRGAGFHNTKPSVLDTLLDLAERHLLLLATTTAQHALSAHNEPHNPTLSDVRAALQDCGVLVPLEGAAQEAWTELMRPADAELADVQKGAGQRVAGEKRRREEEDLMDVRLFLRWFAGSQYGEIKRVAGLVPDVGGVGGAAAGAVPIVAAAGGVNAGVGGGGGAAAAAVGVGGGVIQANDYLTVLKKKHGKVGDDTRWQGTVLGSQAEDKAIVVEGGPVQHIRDWRPRTEQRVEDDVMKDSISNEGSALSSPATITSDAMAVD